MRKQLPKNGDLIIRTFFAFFPVRVKYESRWLEKVCVRYRYNGLYGYWEPIAFIDEGC